MSDKEKLMEAINKLIKHDSNFVANLSKLADLAEKKPYVYKQAVEQLNKL